jgi:hypothetical protein
MLIMPSWNHGIMDAVFFVRSDSFLVQYVALAEADASMLPVDDATALQDKLAALVCVRIVIFKYIPQLSCRCAVLLEPDWNRGTITSFISRSCVLLRRWAPGRSRC